MRVAARVARLAVAFLLVSAAACGPGLTPEEEIEVARSHFSVELTSWTVNQAPTPPAAAGETEAVETESVELQSRGIRSGRFLQSGIRKPNPINGKLWPTI